MASGSSTTKAIFGSMLDSGELDHQAVVLFGLLLALERGKRTLSSSYEGSCGGDLLLQYNKMFPDGAKRSKVNITSRLNDLFKRGLVVVIGDKTCPIENTTTQSWRITSLAERAMFKRLGLITDKRAACSPETLAVANLLFKDKFLFDYVRTTYPSYVRYLLHIRIEAGWQLVKEYDAEQYKKFETMGRSKFLRYACEQHAKRAVLRPPAVNDDALLTILRMEKRLAKAR